MEEKRKTPACDGASEIVLQAYFRNHNTHSQHKPQVLRIADDPIMQRAVSKICTQGSRMVLELLSTLAEQNIQAVAVEREIKRFALLPEGALRALGCDQIQDFQPMGVTR